MSGQFGKGLILDPVGHMYTSARRLLGVAMPRPNGSVNQFAPPIQDQGQKSACTGYGTGGAFMTSAGASGIALPWKLVSFDWNYKIGRAVDRDNPDEPLVDEGAMPNQVVRGIEEFGMLGYDDCSATDADVNEEPSIIQLEKASKVHALGWNEIQSTGPNLVLDLMRAIDIAKVACPVSSDVDQAFEDYDGKGTIPDVITGEDLGGHMYYVTEYQTNSAGKKLFRFRNSWTDTWGDKGTGWVTDEFVMKRFTSAFAASAKIRGVT